MILNDIDNAYVGTDQVDKIYLGDTEIYSTGPAPVDYRSMPLTVEVLSAGTLQLTNTTSQTDIYYNLNDDGWQLINTNNMSFNLQAGDIIQFGATEAVDLQQYSAGRSLFSGNTLAFKVYGNIESLEYGYNNFINQDTSVYLPSAFTNCFKSCSGLTDASNLVLPATTLATRCYLAMFWCCTSLTSAPELPSTTLTQSCYSSMFQGCTSLVQAPELPATTLAKTCYAGMFSGCTSLNYIKCLATNPSSAFIFGNVYTWVNGVQTNSGTFIKNPLTTSWTTGADGIPTNWTILSAHPGEVWFEQSGGSGYPGNTSDNESYMWLSPGPGEEWTPSNNRFWIVDDGHLVKADYQACGYEFDCDGVSITGSEGGWDDDNQEWIHCKSVTGATAFTTSYKIYEIGYTRASGNTPASVYIATQSNPPCEDCGLCTDEFGNCIECPDPCDDWEGNGYSSYEDCTCQNHGENCEEP